MGFWTASLFGTAAAENTAALILRFGSRLGGIGRFRLAAGFWDKGVFKNRLGLAGLYGLSETAVGVFEKIILVVVGLRKFSQFIHEPHGLASKLYCAVGSIYIQSVYFV